MLKIPERETARDPIMEDTEYAAYPSHRSSYPVPPHGQHHPRTEVEHTHTAQGGHGDRAGKIRQTESAPNLAAHSYVNVKPCPPSTQSQIRREGATRKDNSKRYTRGHTGAPVVEMDAAGDGRMYSVVDSDDDQDDDNIYHEPNFGDEHVRDYLFSFKLNNMKHECTLFCFDHQTFQICSII